MMAIRNALISCAWAVLLAGCASVMRKHESICSPFEKQVASDWLEHTKTGYPKEYLQSTHPIGNQVCLRDKSRLCRYHLRRVGSIWTPTFRLQETAWFCPTERVYWVNVTGGDFLLRDEWYGPFSITDSETKEMAPRSKNSRF
jgi:hypothetical protein